MIAPGITEADLAAELDHRIRLGGAERTSFETIVASGPNSALPHARPGGRRLEVGDLVVIDVGAIVDGYCSDMTRTFGIGELPGRSVELYRAVERAQRAGLAACAPAPPPRPSMPRAANRSRPTASPSGSPMAPGTAWASTFTRHRGSQRAPMLRSPPALWSPSSRVCTWQDTAAFASRTRLWSPMTAASP